MLLLASPRNAFALIASPCMSNGHSRWMRLCATNSAMGVRYCNQARHRLAPAASRKDMGAMAASTIFNGYWRRDDYHSRHWLPVSERIWPAVSFPSLLDPPASGTPNHVSDGQRPSL